MRYQGEPFAMQAPDVPGCELTTEQDADYVSYELTRTMALRIQRYSSNLEAAGLPVGSG